jgi:hypothetical protein
MDIISACREVGTYRGAAVISGTTHKTVKRVIARHEAGAVAARVPRARNYDAVAELVAARVKASSGRISAKRLLPAARAAGYAGSARNFRRLVAECKQASWPLTPAGLQQSRLRTVTAACATACTGPVIVLATQCDRNSAAPSPWRARIADSGRLRSAPSVQKRARRLPSSDAALRLATAKFVANLHDQPNDRETLIQLAGLPPAGSMGTLVRAYR